MRGSAQSCSCGVRRLGSPGGVSLAFFVIQPGLLPMVFSQARSLAACVSTALRSKRRTVSDCFFRLRDIVMQREANDGSSGTLEAKALGPNRQYSSGPRM